MALWIGLTAAVLLGVIDVSTTAVATAGRGSGTRLPCRPRGPAGMEYALDDPLINLEILDRLVLPAARRWSAVRLDVAADPVDPAAHQESGNRK